MTAIKLQSKRSNKQSLDGVVIGVLVGITDKGMPLVIYPSNPEETAIKASTTTNMDASDIGKEVALLFEGGNPQNPIIIGRIQDPNVSVKSKQQEQAQGLNQATAINADIDGEHITLSGKQSITLKCGRASITLTKSGKILVRGTYILNRSSGVNRIKGGSVQIN